MKKLKRQPDRATLSFEDVQKLIAQMEKEQICSNYTFPSSPSSDGYYHIYLPDPSRKSGRRQIKAKTLNDLKDRVYSNEKVRSEEGTKSMPTFQEVFEWVMDEKLQYVKDPEKLISVKNCIAVTRSSYKRFFKGSAFEQTRVNEITKENIENVCFDNLKRLDVRPKAFLAMRGIIKSVMKYAYNRYWIIDNPYNRIDFGKYNDMLIKPTPVSKRVHSDEEVKKILDEIHQKQKRNPNYITPYALELQIMMGLRTGEIGPLELDDIGENAININKEQILEIKTDERKAAHRVVHHTKTYVDRVFPITDEIRAFLDKYLPILEKNYPGSKYLFPEPRNEIGIISNRATYKLYQRICRKLGIEISRQTIKGTHSFRRNAITRVTNNSGGDLLLASQLFGNSPETARRNYYTGYDFERALKALSR